MVYETFSAEETARLGRKIAEQIQPGSVCALSGDLGVGKTVFTQGIAQGLGIEESVCSPTFTILQEYEEGRMPFYHFDVYRIADPEEMMEIGYEDYFYGDGFTIVEWADLIPELLPERYLKIKIEKDPEKGFDYRRITVEDKVQSGAGDGERL
ncbi:tRNA threonylcarbamoyladenosine biosynthesis protein TsaE [Eubacterium plexicaudatum ASF492]|uniref:tRNA threonylcarbamoyladenosine biosynthesis protein TsaE n=1 Tax=Eubacterium plexicaudatum ASF492 TaxID=1235802 RepID=N2ACG9_9FIRM|nr:tRNA threonylcarbamoyladenosine biosynthesis protein TsaE [Eubacterium plexicaudatum ASF492]